MGGVLTRLCKEKIRLPSKWNKCICSPPISSAAAYAKPPFALPFDVCRSWFVDSGGKEYIIICCNGWWAWSKAVFWSWIIFKETLCVSERFKKLMTEWQSCSHFLPSGPLLFQVFWGMSRLILLEFILSHFLGGSAFISAAYLCGVFLYVRVHNEQRSTH